MSLLRRGVEKLGMLLFAGGLRPFDTSDEAGRALERRRRARLSVVANLLSRAMVLVSFVLAARLALADLGEVRFGIWMTISSLLVVLSILDFGIGNGLVAPIARATARRDEIEVSQILTRGIALSFLLGCVLALLIAIGAFAGPVQFLFRGVPATVLPEARYALATFGILVGVSLPLTAAQRAMAGLQRAYLVHLAILGAAILTVALLVAMAGRSGLSIVAYILVTFGVTQFVGLVMAFLLYTEGRIVPSVLARSCWSDYRPLVSTGGLYFSLQIGVMLIWGVDQVLISAVRGPTDAALYAIVARIFSLATQPFYVLNAPLWAGYADAISCGDWAYVRRTLKRSLGGTFVLATAISLTLLLFGHQVWTLFTAGELPYPTLLMAFFAFWAVLESSGVALAMFLNGAHIVREQVMAVAIVVALTLPAKIYLLTFYGVSYVPLATATGYLLGTTLCYGLFFRRRLLAAAGIGAKAGSRATRGD